MKRLALLTCGFLIGLTITFTMTFTAAHAQEAPLMIADQEYGLELGYVLPNGIHGLKEIMSVWGGHYAFATGPGLAEIGFLTGSGSGSEYSQFSIGYRADIDMGRWIAIAGGGPILTHYSPRDMKDHVSVLGGYAQLGAMLPLGTNVFFDGNFRFFASPGTALYVGFGFVVRL